MEEGKEVAARNANPFAQRQAAGALVSVEQQRAVAEVQAAMVVARSMPRDRVQVLDLVAQDCADVELAEEAEYEFSRGGTKISGPSIRLLEAVARRWGNMESGVKELARRDGYSECEAYAWDMETGYRDKRVFQVKHWRDTKQGGYELTDERDIYELIANQGARRKRACMETVIPRNVIDIAQRQCQLTLKTKVTITPELIATMLTNFATFGVTKEHIEKRIQRHIDAITPALVIQLRRVYTSMKDGMSSPAEWFDIQVGETAEKTASGRKKPQAKDKPKVDDVPPEYKNDTIVVTDSAGMTATATISGPTVGDLTPKATQAPAAAAPELKLDGGGANPNATLSDEQIAAIKKKMEAFAVNENDLLRAFKIPALPHLKAILYAAALKWCGDPTQAPQS